MRWHAVAVRIHQFRAVITPEASHRFVLHDRDSMYTATVDRAIASMGRHVLKTPAWTPQANAFCERVIGTLRRECLDWLIPIHEGHLRLVLREWMTHDNRGRPHARLGPGIPQPVPDADQVTGSWTFDSARPMGGPSPARPDLCKGCLAAGTAARPSRRPPAIASTAVDELESGGEPLEVRVTPRPARAIERRADRDRRGGV